MNASYDVVVVGGGAAGLSGALMLGRSRRSVLVIDAGAPRNAPAAAMHGYLGRDGTPPADLLAAGRAEVASYGVEVVSGEAVSAAGSVQDGFEVALGDGRRVRARRLLIATGLVDELPDVPGIRERWGHDVLHCPYCHGWEVRDESIGVLASGPMAVHQALLFRQLSDDVTLFTHTAPPLAPESADQLAARGVAVVDGRVTGLELAGDRIAGLRLESGELVPRRFVVVGPRMVARSALLEGLGLRPLEHPMGVGEHVERDPMGLTSVPGVWVAGNVGDLAATVVGAAGDGVKAGAAINADLAMEEARAAVAAATGARAA